MQQNLELSGNVKGEFVATINKRDVDVTFALYEQLPDGRHFFLNRFVGRASYARDRSSRELLTPGERTVIPFHETKLISRQLSQGSRLVLVFSVNKHPYEEINYGTGKVVRSETIDDAGSPLKVLLHADSFIDIPLWQE